MQNVNPYDKQALPTKIFLERTYTLMRNKIFRLLEIEKSKIRGKLPLPLLKEKVETISKILEALGMLLTNIDYNNKEAHELSNILNDIGILLSQANITDDTNIAQLKYDIVIVTLDEFLS